MSDKAGTTLSQLRARARGLCMAVLGAAGLALGAGLPAHPPMEEYAVKSRAMVELPPYFQWGEERGPARNFVIAVVGRSPFGDRLDASVRGRTVQNRKIEVRYTGRPADLESCDMVFICRSERRNAAEILGWARDRGVLTVADDEDLLARGVVVDLLIERGMLKLCVNLQAAAAGRLVVSPQLLRLAKIVDGR